MQFFFLCFEMYCKCVAGPDLEGRHDEIEEKSKRTDRLKGGSWGSSVRSVRVWPQYENIE